MVQETEVRVEENSVQSSRYALLDHVPLGVCVLSSALTVRFWNTCLESWTGIPRTEVLGSDLSAKERQQTRSSALITLAHILFWTLVAVSLAAMRGSLYGLARACRMDWEAAKAFVKKEQGRIAALRRV